MKNVSISHAWRILFSHNKISTSIVSGCFFFLNGFRFIVSQKQPIDLMTKKSNLGKVSPTKFFG